MSDAFLGVVLGGAIAIAGAFVNGWWSARAQRLREHEARVHSWRGEAYKELLRLLRTQGVRIEMVMPVLDQGEPIPDPPSQTDTDTIVAGVEAYGSSEVRALVEEMRKLSNRFYRKVQAYQEEKARGAASGSREQLERYRSVEELREQFRAQHTVIRNLVARELQGTK